MERKIGGLWIDQRYSLVYQGRSHVDSTDINPPSTSKTPAPNHRALISPFRIYSFSLKHLLNLSFTRSYTLIEFLFCYYSCFRVIIAQCLEGGCSDHIPFWLSFLIISESPRYLSGLVPGLLIVISALSYCIRVTWHLRMYIECPGRRSPLSKYSYVTYVLPRHSCSSVCQNYPRGHLPAIAITFHHR